jgi:hypothetical protein
VIALYPALGQQYAHIPIPGAQDVNGAKLILDFFKVVQQPQFIKD